MIKKTTLLTLTFIAANLFVIADSWTQKAPFPIQNRWQSVGFSIGNKGYLGTGTQGFSIMNDFWEYDPATDAWTQKADVGGHGRQEAVGFSIGNKGYICLGSGFGSDYQNDVWEYDPGANTWTGKNNFPGLGRLHSTVFTIGNKAYLGGGTDSLSVVHTDFYEYNPATDTWTQKADMFERLEGAVGFSLSEYGYFCTGSDTLGYSTKLWQYNPNNNQWTVKADLPATPRWEAVGFALCEKGYIGMGSSINDPADWWQYDPLTDAWSQKTSLLLPRYDAIAFVINNKGYMGTGDDSPYPNDWAEYNPDSACTIGIEELNEAIQFEIAPSVVHEYCSVQFNSATTKNGITMKVTDVNGRLIFFQNNFSNKNFIRINTRDFTTGIYFVTIENESGSMTKKFIKD
ncbi:MAG: kelch repeat-containing protein [Bacteroidota bacterium]